VTRRLIFFGTFVLLAAVGVAVTLPGCNTTAVPAGTTATSVPFSPGTVYVADNLKQQIVLLPPSPGPNSQPANPIAGSSTGLTGPQAMRFDGTHRLYVANYNGSSSILIFPVGAQNNVAPTVVTSPQLGQIFGVAVDSYLNFYATTVLNGTSQLLIFPKGSTGSVTSPTVISANNNSLASPRGMSFDGQGNLWIANAGPANASVVGYSPSLFLTNGTPVASSNPAPGATVTYSGFQTPVDVVFDGLGDMYVCDSTANAIFVFPPNPNGATTPIRTISGTATTLNGPMGIALGLDGTLYVANTGAKNLLLFPPVSNGNVAPEATITTTLGSATDVEITF
jgi:hypothetical protein